IGRDGGADRAHRPAEPCGHQRRQEHEQERPMDELDEADRDGEEPDVALRFQVRGMEVASVLWRAGLGLVPASWASRVRWATTCWVASGRASPAAACFIAVRRAGSARSVSSM